MGQKWFFGPNSPGKILIFCETIHFYNILKKKSNPGKLQTLGVEVALGEVCIMRTYFVKEGFCEDGVVVAGGEVAGVHWVAELAGVVAGDLSPVLPEGGALESN